MAKIHLMVCDRCNTIINNDNIYCTDIMKEVKIKDKNNIHKDSRTNYYFNTEDNEYYELCEKCYLGLMQYLTTKPIQYFK